MPVLLLGCGLLFSSYLHFFWIVHPVKFFRSLKKGLTGGGQTPFKAMTVALAGTLGVGNIAGVASAIVAGGAGAGVSLSPAAFLLVGNGQIRCIPVQNDLILQIGECLRQFTERKEGEGC